MTKIKLCINCRHYALEKDTNPPPMDAEAGYEHYCNAIIDVVTGKRSRVHACVFARAINSPCGPDARLFEAKP